MIVQLDKLVEIISGRLLADNRPEKDTLSGITTDSRTVEPGDVFFALKGEQFDGHAFVVQVAQAGAHVLVVSEEVSVPNVAIVLVEDTLLALGQLAAWWRRQNAAIPISAIVGSSGKTTTKEMAGEILSRFYNTLTTKGNFNNLIGLPQTLFQLQASHEAAVLELGMNCPDENRRLVEIAQPNCIALTNINHAHIGMFASPEDHYRAEAEPLIYAADDALLIINDDDELSRRAHTEFAQGRRTWRYSVEKPADFYAEKIEALHPFGYEFVLRNAAGESADVELKVFGRHNVSNAVAAAAVAAFHGIKLEDAAAQLTMFRPRYNRSEVEEIDGVYVIKDYYNAIPAAVISALRSLEDMDFPGRKYAVLGDMMELGDHERRFHHEVADAAAEAGLEELFTIGQRGALIHERATELGVPCRHFESMEALAAELRRVLKRGDLLLIKGSRALKLEQLYDLLKNSVTVS